MVKKWYLHAYEIDTNTRHRVTAVAGSMQVGTGGSFVEKVVP